MNHKDLVCGDILGQVTRGEEWYASTLLTLVESRVLGPDFKVKKRGRIHKRAMGVDTLNNHMEGMKRVRECNNKIDDIYRED